MPRLATKSPAPTLVPDDIALPPKFPELPDDVLKRFPSLEGWEEDTDAWWSRANSALQQSNNWVSQTVTNVIQQNGDLRVSINGATAAIATETAARITADEILARRIVTVSAIAGVSTNIKVQGTAPVGPALNDYWVNNTDILNPITYQWSGTAWVEVTEPISVAAVAAEQTARITADGFLQGKYTLTVVAGNVVTGMNITSSTGTGTDISSVIFNATNFLIYNGVTGVAMFNVAGSDVQLAQTLTVSTAGKVYIGAGNYGNADTAWYVDSTGQFSLKNKLTWDGTDLTIVGSITLTSPIPASDVSGLAATATSSDFAVVTGATKPANNATVGAVFGSNLSGGPFNAPSGAGLYIDSTHLGYYDGAVWNAYLDASGNFYLGGTSGSLQWNGTTLTVNGVVNSTSGNIGGFNIGPTSLVSTDPAGTLTISSGGYAISMIETATGSAINLSPYGGVAIQRPAGNFIFGSQRTTDTVGRFAIDVDGAMSWGNGIGSKDTNLYRSAANTLKTDDTFVAANLSTAGFVSANQVSATVLQFGTYVATPSAVAGYILAYDSGGAPVKLAVLT